MIKVLMFRHGLTDYNVKGLMNATTDVPLNLKGLGQVLVLAEQLENEKIDLLISSDLSRANQTARQIKRKNKHDFPMILSPKLREIDLGVVEGKPFLEMQKQYSDIFAAQRDPSGYFDVALPKGETQREVINRVLDCIEEALNQYGNIKTLAISTHGGVLRSFDKYVNGQSRNYNNCEILEFQYSLEQGKLIRAVT